MPRKKAKIEEDTSICMWKLQRRKTMNSCGPTRTRGGMFLGALLVADRVKRINSWGCGRMSSQLSSHYPCGKGDDREPGAGCQDVSRVGRRRWD